MDVPNARISKLEALPALSEGEQSLLVWITAFSSSHIGMSAIRQTLIKDFFGRFLANDILGIVGTGRFQLPDTWPGDSSGTNELFPDLETTGRQFYRIFYTMISFLTLGTAFSIYLGLRSEYVPDAISSDTGNPWILLSYVLATLSGAVSLASLVNASPLGLMPSFRRKEEDGGGRVLAASTVGTAGDTVLGITRDDALKFDPRGLTRITRHPLILPVVPWGMATSVLAGGRPAETILFGGLSLYALAGCYCQDLRVLKEEGSVGTVFFESEDEAEGKLRGSQLKTFYEQTSFLPFGALLDGRQQWDSAAREFPILPFVLAIPSAFFIETAFLRFLGVDQHILL
jgi:hypothetical protein